MRKMKYPALLVILMITVLFACKKDETNDPSEGKATITGLAIDPQSGLQYGDIVNLTADFSDAIGLKSFTVKMSNTSGVIFEETKMLTGKTFSLDEDLTIPLPKDAVAGDMTVSVTLKNSGDKLTTEEVVISDLSLPVINSLFVIINNKVYTMTKNGDVFELEDFIPAGAVGKIYTSTDKTGLAWGLDGADIIAMGSGDITLGKETEEYFKISFNPVSFELTLGDAQEWAPIADGLYILGNISGHWADGNITTEKSKMLMSGFSLGNRKMWTWTPPNTNTGSPDDDMWGNIVAGNFRFKKPGVEEYILLTEGQITYGTTNDEASSFVVTAGGPFTIKVFSDGTDITKVSLESETRKLEYTTDGIYINGSKVGTTITFGGSTLSLVAGNYFLYEGTMTLTKDQAISAEGIDLRTAFCDPDVFTGKGNPSWSVIQATGNYLVRIDPFLGNIYVRNEDGYPAVIYLDGWCWGKFEDDSHSWNPDTRMTLYRVGTSFVYEANMYILPWGGDVAIFAAPVSDPDYSKKEIFSKYFDGVEMAGHGFKLPVPDPAAFYKVSVDLKDGFSFDTETMDEETNFTVVPVNGKKFTVTFTPLTK
jgi:hypothetical protein